MTCRLCPGGWWAHPVHACLPAPPLSPWLTEEKVAWLLASRGSAAGPFRLARALPYKPLLSPESREFPGKPANPPTTWVRGSMQSSSWEQDHSFLPSFLGSRSAWLLACSLARPCKRRTTHERHASVHCVPHSPPPRPNPAVLTSVLGLKSSFQETPRPSQAHPRAVLCSLEF